MTAPSSLPNLKKPLWRRFLKWTFRTLIVLVVLAVAAYSITSYWAARSIHNEIARIRAAGEPLTFADLDALTPKVDRAKDAGPYYAAAAELVNPEIDTDANDVINDIAISGQDAGVISPETLAWAHRNLDRNSLPLELLDRGSKLPGCNWDIQLQYGIAVAMPRMQKIRDLMEAVSLRSRVLAIEGHGDAAVESIISSLGLMRCMDRQPVVIDELNALAMLTRASGDARFALERGHLSDAALQKLDATMRRLPLIQPRQMFLAERVYFLEVTRSLIASGRRMDSGDNGEPLLPEAGQWSSLGVTGRVIAARSLSAYAQYVAAASRGWPAVMTGVEKVAARATTQWDKISGPSFVMAMVDYGRTTSLYRSTLIAIRIERYRLAHDGKLPDSLAQLPNANDLPKDPFTGNSLIYLKTPDGYCVFSAGRGHPEDSKVNRDKDPVARSEHWGVHIRIPAP